MTNNTKEKKGVKLNVLSLFDGLSCGSLALNYLEINPDNYIASEVDKFAIKVSTFRHKNIIHVGDIKNIYYENNALYNKDGIILFKGKIDLLIGGSPCQSFSFSGKQNGMTTICKQEVLNLNTYLKLKSLNYEFEGQSYLFWEYFRLLKEVNPEFFLLENVQMIKKWESVLSENIGFSSTLINSSLVSAQNRNRLYWVGKKNSLDGEYSKFEISQPKDLNVKLKDILVFDANTSKFKNISSIVGRRLNENGVRDDYNKDIKITQCLQVKKNHDKSGTLTTVQKDNVLSVLPHGRYKIEDLPYSGAAQRGRYINKEKTKTSQFIEIRDDDKGNCLTTTIKNSLVIANTSENQYFYRNLSVVECCRLQTIPDNYFTGIVSDSQAYKMIGNGWTVKVISHILNEIFDDSYWKK